MRGSCVNADLCSCQAGYTGPRCNITVCYAKRADHPQVCSASGMCIGPNLCQCNNGTSGIECELTSCFGKAKYDRTVCSSHGACIQADVCNCTASYSGSTCEISTCYDKLSTDATVCNGEGYCTALNTCKCNNTRKYRDCSTCLPMYTGANCERLTCDDTLTCSAHGACNSQLRCTCHASPSLGYWTSTYCDKCATNYVGPQCNIFCNPAIACAAHGTCNSDGTCACFDDDVRGHWVASNCTTCATGYYGPLCATSATNFTFSDSSDRIRGTYSYEKRYGRRQVDCVELFESHVIAQFGTGARCWWPNPYDQVLEVLFGERATLMPNTFININMRPFSTTKEYLGIFVKEPANPTSPKASLKSPPTLGICDNVPLDAAASNSPDRRSLQYVWNAVSGYRLEQLNQFLSLQSLPFISIPSEYVEPGFYYVVAVTVSNFLNITSNPASVTFAKLSSGVPVVSIDGPLVQYVTQTQQRFIVTGQVKTQKCRTSTVSEATTEWLQDRTIGMPTAYEQRNTELIITAFPFSSFSYTLKFSFRAYRSAQPTLASITNVYIIVSPAKLVPIISGGSNRTLNTAQQLVLDASASHDPANSNATSIFNWRCINSETNGLCSFKSIINPLKPSILTVQPNTATPGNYTFYLRYAKDGRVSSSSVLVTFTEAPSVTMVYPIVSVSISHQKIHANMAKVTARGSAYIANMNLQSRAFSYAWSLTETTGEKKELANTVAISATTEPAFVFSPKLLAEGHSYELRLTANYTNPDSQIASSYAMTTFNVTEAPLVGIFFVYPTLGTAMETDFNLNCQQFTSENPPLQYAFSYLDYQGKQVPLSFFSQSNLLTVTLPPGKHSNAYNLTIVATIKDAIGAILSAQQVLQVKPPLSMQSVTTNASQPINATLNFLRQEAAAITSTPSMSDRENSALISKMNVLLELLNDDNPGTENTRTTTISSTAVQGKQVRDSNCPVFVALSCPNNCSNAGSCVEGRCVCKEGKTGRDCRYTETELREKEELRYTLLNGVFSAIERQLDNNVEDSVAVEQLAILCNKLTSIYEEVNSTSQHLVVNFLTKLVESPSVNEDIADILMQTISNIALSMQHRIENILDTTKLNVTTGMFAASETLLKKLALSKDTGEKPTIFNAVTMSSVMYRTYRDLLGSQSISICSGAPNETNSEVFLPSLFSSVDSNSNSTSDVFGDEVPEEVNVKFSAFRQNPYYYSASSKNISSDVVRIDLLSNAGNYIKLKNLAEHIVIKLAIKDMSMFKQNFSRVQWTCKYWNVSALEWRNDGCKLGNVSIEDGTVSCMCNHTTDFSVFLEEIPQTSMATPTPGQNIINVLKDKNFGTVVGASAVAVLFVVLIIASAILDKIITSCALATKKNEFSSLSVTKEKEVELEEKSKFRRLLNALLNSYLLPSMFVPIQWTRNMLYQQQAELSKLEKTVLVYVGTCVMLALQALMDYSSSACVFEGISAEWCTVLVKNYGWIINSIGAAIVGSLTYRILGYLLIKTAPRSLSKIQSELVLVQQSKYQESSSQVFETSISDSPEWRPSTPVPFIARVATPMFRDTVTPSTPQSPKPLLHAPSSDNRVPATRWFNKLDSCFNGIHQVLFAGNSVKRFFFASVFFLMATCLYLIIGAGFALSMHFVLPFKNYWTVAVTCGLVILTWIMYMQSVYFQLKYELRNQISGYHVGNLIIGAIGLVVSLVAALGSNASAIFISNITFYSALVAIGMWAMFVVCLFHVACSLILLYKAKRNKIANDNDADTNSSQSIYWFPSWFSMVIYITLLVLAGASNFAMVFMGLYFDAARSSMWIYTSITSVFVDQLVLTLLVALFVSLVQPCLRLVLKDYLRCCKK